MIVNVNKWQNFMFILFLKGLLIGFAIAAPVGPIGLLCIQRSLRDGFRVGFASGMGAATADSLYGLIAGFGLTAVSSLLITYQFWIQLMGGIFLLYLGIKLLLTPAQEQTITLKTDKSLWHAYSTTFFLTLTNPITILSFVGIFAGLGLENANTHYMDALVLVIGITLGSAFWWIFLSGGVTFILRHRVSITMLRGINWLSGIIILMFGMAALIY